MSCLRLINFQKKCTHLVLHASKWTHKITIAIITFLFPLDRGSDRIQQYGTGYFANIHIRIIRAFFHIKQKKCATLVIKQLPYNPKSIKFQNDWLFWSFSPKTASKTRQFVCDKLFNFRPSFHEIAWLQSYKCSKTFCTGNKLKCCVGPTLLSEDSQVFGCVSPWTHFCLFLDDHWNSVSGLGIERRFNSRLEGLWHFVYKINSHYQNSQEWPSVHELMCNNPQYQPFEAASWGQGQTQCQFLLVRESDVHVLNHICLSPLISNCMKSVRKSGFLF